MGEVREMMMSGLAAVVPTLSGRGTLPDQFLQFQPIFDLFAQQLENLGAGRRSGAHVAAGEGAWGAFSRLIRVAVGSKRGEEGVGRAGIEAVRAVALLQQGKDFKKLFSGGQMMSTYVYISTTYYLLQINCTNTVSTAGFLPAFRLFISHLRVFWHSYYSTVRLHQYIASAMKNMNNCMFNL